MRTTVKERNQAARNFYYSLMTGSSGKSAIVVNRTPSKNPNISRCQFLATTSVIASKPVIIAESVLGLEGAFIEFLNAVKPSTQKTFYERGFSEWLEETYGFVITYNDGLVMIVERQTGTFDENKDE